MYNVQSELILTVLLSTFEYLSSFKLETLAQERLSIFVTYYILKILSRSKKVKTNKPNTFLQISRYLSSKVKVP